MEKNYLKWTEFYMELADKLLDFKNSRNELVPKVENIYKRINMEHAKWENGDLCDIDPFTIFAFFNKGITDDKRIKIMESIKEEFSLNNEVPTYLVGIPCVNNLKATFYYFIPRGEHDIDNLWDVFSCAINYVDNKNSENKEKLINSYNTVLKQLGVNWNITMGLYWIRPFEFINLDYTNRDFMTNKEFVSDEFIKIVPNLKNIPNGEVYFKLCDDVKTYFDIGECNYHNFPELSIEARIQYLSINKKAYKDKENYKYWWVTTDPNVFSFREINIGESREFSIFNDKDNRKNVTINFDNVKKGDSVILYESHDSQEVIGLGEIEHENNGVSIGIKLNEFFENPISKKDLIEVDLLKESQPFKIERGTLFGLTKEQYDYILNYSKEVNLNNASVQKLNKYSKDDFLNDVFMDSETYDDIKNHLDTKLNIILQGPPGVGKTYLARKLAYSIIGECDDSLIEFVQFHQSYSYEDFVLGYKPDGEGFKLIDGVFTRFNDEAIKHPNKKYFLIIDEINRGNLSKIFGELLMAIENGYRDSIEISLAYEGRKLRVPKNLYIIGMMNTADRSLAMIDYALRRRFGFIDIKPAFDSDGFIKHQKQINFEKFDKLIELIKSLNEEIKIDDSLGEGFCIGHSYFSDVDKYEKYRDINVLKNIIKFEILTTLKEYWFDDKDKYEKWEKALKEVIENDNR